MNLRNGVQGRRRELHLYKKWKNKKKRMTKEVIRKKEVKTVCVKHEWRRSVLKTIEKRWQGWLLLFATLPQVVFVLSVSELNSNFLFLSFAEDYRLWHSHANCKISTVWPHSLSLVFSWTSPPTPQYPLRSDISFQILFRNEQQPNHEPRAYNSRYFIIHFEDEIK